MIGDILTIEDNLELQYDLGLEDGMKTGMRKGLLNTAKNMLSEGVSKLDISKCTGLSIEEIDSL